MKGEAQKQASKDIWIYIQTKPESRNPFIDQWFVTPKYIFTKESEFLNKLLNV